MELDLVQLTAEPMGEAQPSPAHSYTHSYNLVAQAQVAASFSTGERALSGQRLTVATEGGLSFFFSLIV